MLLNQTIDCVWFDLNLLFFLSLCVPTDDSSSSTAVLTFQTPSQHHLCQGYDVNLTILPSSSSSSSPYASGRTLASPISPSGWSRSNQSFTPAISPVGAGSCLGLRERQPVRKWSSLTELSSGAPKSSTQTSGHQYNQFSQGSLDRGLLYGFRRESIDSNANLHLHLSPSLSGQSLQQLSPVASPCYRYNNSSGLRELETDPSHLSSSPAKHDTLDMNYNALSEATLPQVGRQVSIPKVDPWMSLHTNEGRNVQTALRTQMWLNEQMEYRPKAVHGSNFGQITTSTGPEDCDADGLSPRQQKHQRDPGLKQVIPIQIMMDQQKEIKSSWQWSETLFTTDVHNWFTDFISSSFSADGYIIWCLAV